MRAIHFNNFICNITCSLVVTPRRRRAAGVERRAKGGPLRPSAGQGSKMKKTVKLVIASVAAVIALAAAGHYGWQYYTVGRFEESTDDAYLKADITAIAPKVAGYIT